MQSSSDYKKNFSQFMTTLNYYYGKFKQPLRTDGNNKLYLQPELGIFSTDKMMVLKSNKEFKLFFEAYFEPVYRFTRKYTEDASIARDIAQDTFIRIYERRADFDVFEKAKSFAYTTARNLCLDYLKHQKIEQQYTLRLNENEDNRSFLHEITYQETLRLLHKAIDNLSPQTREIILLGLEGNNNNEIAELLNISVNTVKTLKKGAYKKLKDILGKDFIFILTLFIG